MKTLNRALAILIFSAGPAAAQDAAGAQAVSQAPDAVEEMANALMKSGALAQSDWWKIKTLRGAELKVPVPEPANNLPPAGTPPTASPAQPPAALVCPSTAAAPGPAPAPPAPPAVTLGKGVTIKIGGLGQFRYTYADAAPNAVNTSALGLKTARLKFSGDLPGSFKYSVQLAFDRIHASTAQVNSALYDYALIYAPGPALSFTFGQFTVPMGAEALAPLDQLDFAARYYAQDRMLNPSANHDVGAMVSGKALKQRLQYSAGVFNGKGANYCDNDNDKFLYAGRLVWTAYKGKLRGKEASLLLGGGAMGESTRNDPSSMRASDIGTVVFTRAYRRYVYGGDFVFKAGPAALKGEYIAARLDGRLADSDINAYGWHTTAAYRLPGDKVELLARWQGYDPNTARRTSKDIKWTTLGVNWFINGNNARVLANYTIKKEAVSPVDNNEFVAQLQLSF